ncbi:MAG TPA: NADH-quinone oxidoreductase subunit C, partial [Giesbergeria sp.]|nr:NADH-quinone oxidoreductase subunit C [Giesbergeria sp.]
MTSVAIRPEELRNHIAQALGALARSVTLARGEVTVVVAADQYLQAMQLLRDAPTCRFEQLIDLCGLDYSAYADRVNEGPRYAV